jgi:DNA-binding response OmpR family regulator
MKSTILIIDDSNDIHRLIRSALSTDPWHVRSAYTGSQGLDIAAAGGIDLILLDVDLPDMNGFDVCRHLKAEPIASQASVVFLSTLSTIDAKACALSLKAEDYVTKPFDPADLEHRIQATLRMKHLLDIVAAGPPQIHFTSRLADATDGQ